MGILRKLFDALGGRSTTTDVLELLAAQHAELDMLFEAIEKGHGNRRALFTALADRLAAHATVEEKIFYPMVMTRETSSLLLESVEEHLALKRILADMIDLGSTDDDVFRAKLAVLKETVSHHAHEEEEKKLFPLVREMFDEDQRAAIGNEVIVMFETLMQSHPYRHVPEETKSPAPLPRP